MRKQLPRAHDRATVLREVRFRVLPGGAGRVGHTLDLSPSGVRLFTDPSLRVGDAIEVVWDGRDPQARASGRVIHVHVDGDGSWAGLQFHAPLAAAALDAIRDLPRG